MEVKGFNGLCLVGWIDVVGVKDLGGWVVVNWSMFIVELRFRVYQ